MHPQLTHSHLQSPVHPRGGENTSIQSNPFDISLSNDLSSIKNMFDDDISLLSFKEEIVKLENLDNSDTKSVQESPITLRESYYGPNKLTNHKIKKRKRINIRIKQSQFSGESWPWQDFRNEESESLNKCCRKLYFFWKGTNVVYPFALSRVLVKQGKKDKKNVVLTKIEDLSNKKVMPRACF